MALLLVFATGALRSAPAGAGTGSAYLSGTIVASGAAVPGVVVTASGNSFTATTTTDASGKFAFASLPIGLYVINAKGTAGSAMTRVDLSGSGATVDLDIGLKEIGSTRVVRSSPVRGSGTDVTLNSTYLQRSPASGSFPEFLIQLPGAVRGANGVVHLNGDHGVVNYFVDGVPIPQALNRQLGSEIDPSDISFVDVIEGAFPAQYGLRFGSTLNISTRAGTGPAGLTGEVRGGAYNSIDQSLGYHAPLGNGGGVSFAVRDQRATRGLDPPNIDSPHNDYSNTNQFLRVVAPRGHNNFTDLTLIHSYRSYQIPNDVLGRQPASSDLNEKQEDTFLNLQFRQSLGDSGSLSFGPALKSRVFAILETNRTTSPTARRSIRRRAGLRPTAPMRSHPARPTGSARVRFHSVTIKPRPTIAFKSIMSSASGRMRFARAERTSTPMWLKPTP